MSIVAAFVQITKSWDYERQIGKLFITQKERLTVANFHLPVFPQFLYFVGDWHGPCNALCITLQQETDHDDDQRFHD